MATLIYKGKWPGEIVLPEYLTISQCAAWEEAAHEANKARVIARQQAALLPAILEIVQEWRLEGFPQPVTVKTFPGSPRSDSKALLDMIISHIVELYSGEEVPLA